jgi:hypothetical protein
MYGALDVGVRSTIHNVEATGKRWPGMIQDWIIGFGETRFEFCNKHNDGGGLRQRPTAHLTGK